MRGLINTSGLKTELGEFHKRVKDRSVALIMQKAAAFTTHANMLLSDAGVARGGITQKLDVHKQSVELVADFKDAKPLEYGVSGRSGLRFMSRSAQKILNESI